MDNFLSYKLVTLVLVMHQYSFNQDPLEGYWSWINFACNQVCLAGSWWRIHIPWNQDCLAGSWSQISILFNLTVSFLCTDYKVAKSIQTSCARWLLHAFPKSEWHLNKKLNLIKTYFPLIQLHFFCLYSFFLIKNLRYKNYT